MGRHNKSRVPRATTLIAVALLLLGAGYLLMKVGFISTPGASNVATQIRASSSRASSSKATAQVKSRVPANRLQEIAKALDPELMESLPTKYNESLKNPCWTSKDGSMLCLPYVYLAGSFQSGYTTLYMMLKEHPDVHTNDATRFQLWGEEGKKMDQYLAAMAKSIPDLQKDPEQSIILDASASTFAFYWSAAIRTHRAYNKVMHPCWKDCAEQSKGKAEAREKCHAEVCFPKAIAADRQVAKDLKVEYDDLHVPLLMQAVYGVRLPKMVVMVRNPIDRLYSAYWGYDHYHSKYGDKAEGFLAYVKEQVGVLRGCESKGYSMRECALYFESLGIEEEKLFFHADQIIRGMYSIFLEGWLRHLRHENVLVLKSEEYFKDNQATLDKVYQFLGLDRPLNEKTKQKILRAGKHSSKTEGKPAILPEVRKMLMELYKPFNEQLAQLTGDDYYLSWNT